jgi:hypothetical protein
MQVQLLSYMLDANLRVEPPTPVEVVALVDGTAFRVAIEWSAIEHLLRAEHAVRADAATVGRVVYGNRFRIERAVKAHLFARGAPPERRVTLSLEDLAPNRRSEPPSVEKPHGVTP